MTAEIGFQLSSIAPYLDTPERIRASFAQIAAIGYRAVQLQGVPREIPDEVIVEALAAAGLECVATQEDYILGFGDDPERAIRRAVAVGAKYLTCALIPYEFDSRAVLEEIAVSLTDIAEQAQAAGITFGFHPIPPDYRMVEGRMVVDQLMELLPDHVHLTFCVSAAHHVGLDPAAILQHYAGRIELVHFKDDAVQPDGSRQLMPLGQGSHDWSTILAMCDAAGVKYVFAEQERWLKDAFVCAAESHAYLHGLRSTAQAD